MKSYPVQYERQHKLFTHIEHHIGVAGRLHSSLLRIFFPGFTVRIAVHTAKKCGRKLSDIYMTIEVQDRRGVALLRYKNSVEITVLMLCEKKLFPV